VTAKAVEQDLQGGQQRLPALLVFRRHAPILVTLLLFVAGAYALNRLLAPLNAADLLATLRATPGTSIAGAIAATAIGYAALVGYDWSALRFIGKTLPLPTVFLGGFLGYAFGNTIGLSAVSGGAVRYRIYSTLGLDAHDVAAIASFAAISYGVGATMIGVGALAIHPAALAGITAIPPGTLRLLSLAVLAGAALGLFLVARRGGTVRIRHLVLNVPSGVDIALQLAFTFVEIVMAALVLHILLPSGGLPFANLLVVYAIATMAGVLSHVPGGIGVFESVVIAAMPAAVPLDAAVTGLLLFRLIYFLLPFAVALAGLSALEVRVRFFRAALVTPLMTAGRLLVPTATGGLVLGSGLFMMFASLLPNPQNTADELEALLPLAMVEGGALTSSILGAVLVVLSISIFRRSRQAYWLVLGLLGAGVVMAIVKTQDVDRAILLAMLFVVLLPFQTAFDRTARIAQGLWSVRWAGLLTAIAAALALTWLMVHENVAQSNTAWWRFGDGAPALAAGRAGLAAAVTLGLGLFLAALRPGRMRTLFPDARALEEAAGIIAEHGHGGDLLALTGDKMLMFGDGAVLSYAAKGGSWIALGAPVGEASGRERLAWAFCDAARSAGARPVFYEAPAAFAETALDLGMMLHKMGEEAVVDLRTFSLEGPSRKRLRTTYNRALRDGLSLNFSAPPHDTALIAELREISDDWLSGHRSREKGFSVGRFDLDWIARCAIATVHEAGRVVAFATVPVATRAGSAAVDLMRHRQDAPPNTMEFLFTALMLRLKDEGLHEFSLGMVPFAGLSTNGKPDLWSRFGTLVYLHGGRFYGFEGLRQFKNKFDPDWRPRYLCCRSLLPPVAPLADAARLISGSTRGIFAK